VELRYEKDNSCGLDISPWNSSESLDGIPSDRVTEEMKNRRDCYKKKVHLPRLNSLNAYKVQSIFFVGST